MMVLSYDERKSFQNVEITFTLLEISSTVIYFVIFTTASLEELQWMLI